MKNKNKSILTGTLLAGAALLGTTGMSAAETSLFSFNELGSGSEVRTSLTSNNTQARADIMAFDLKCGEKSEKTDGKKADSKSKDAKCGEGKCGEGKGGEKTDKKAAGTSDKESAAKADSKSKDAKCGESKSKDAKCGEGKCGN